MSGCERQGAPQPAPPVVRRIVTPRFAGGGLILLTHREQGNSPPHLRRLSRQAMHVFPCFFCWPVLVVVSLLRFPSATAAGCPSGGGGEGDDNGNDADRGGGAPPPTTLTSIESSSDASIPQKRWQPCGGGRWVRGACEKCAAIVRSARGRWCILVFVRRVMSRYSSALLRGSRHARRLSRVLSQPETPGGAESNPPQPGTGARSLGSASE